MKQMLNKSNKVLRALSLSLIVLAFCNLEVFAQGRGAAGLQQATAEIQSYFGVVQQLCYAIAAIIGFIGAIKVYGKFTQGDPDVGKAVASWFGACIFFVIVGVVLQAFFK